MMLHLKIYLVMLTTAMALLPYATLAQGNVKFKRFSLDQGLSTQDIRSIIQDKKGFIWIGTLDGLNRYDGYNFTVYKNNKNKKGSLSNNTIWSLFEDSRGDLYVGTDDGGLNVYNHKKDSFVHFVHDPNDAQSIGGNEVSTIFEDSKGVLWIGTDGGGLNIFDRDTKKFTRILHERSNSNSLICNAIKAIAEDKDGNLWVGTERGISVLDKDRKNCITYQYDQKDVFSLGENYVLSIYIDRDNIKWIGTLNGMYQFNDKAKNFKKYVHEGHPNSIAGNYVPAIYEDKDGMLWVATNYGISVLNKKSGSFTHHVNDVNDKFSLVDNGLNTFYWDRTGNIWVGSYIGLCMKEAGDVKFLHYTHNPDKLNSLKSKEVSAFFEDSKGDIFVGIREGFDKFDRSNDQFEHYQPTSDNHSILGITSFYEDKKKNLWLGTLQGLFLYNRDKDSFKSFTHSTSEGTGNDVQDVWYINEDKKGNIWIASLNKGIHRLDQDKQILEPLEWEGKYIPNKDIFCFYIDKENNFWIGTALEGLFKINKEKGIYEVFKKSDNDEGSISSNFILNILEDAKGNFWVGTRGGLNIMDPKTQTFTSFTEVDGLSNNVINSLIEDNQGNLWMGTLKGLSRYDPINKSFKNYTVEDGLQHNEFWHRSVYKLKSGELMFGGINGFNLFHPDSLKDNDLVPNVYLTDFQIFNKSVDIGPEGSIIDKHISEKKDLILSYKESVFSFDFVALNYVISKNNQYAYKLEGFDKNWNYVGTQRKATYTNLDPGKYTLHVKGSNNDGIWNETGTSLSITITPPFWQTWWFRVFVLVSIIGSAVAWYKNRMNTIKKQKFLLEKQVKERTAEVVAQKQELQAQAENLKEANHEIVQQGAKLSELLSEVNDSIRAALVIQQSILPSEKMIKKYLPESFVFFKPKDVVSGDFYWFDVVDGNIIIASVDCTGHGVSGAFMSINGHHLLNQAIYSHDNLVASEILDRLNAGIIKELSHHDGNNDVYDGMDIALCIISKDKKTMQFAGANNPLYILRNKNIIQVKANKYAIGISVTRAINTFNNNIIELQKNDVIYLFSDGYADQLGGDTGDEKFMYPRFRNLLLEIGEDCFNKQAKKIEDCFMEWKKDQEQMDDILVIGFQI